MKEYCNKTEKLGSREGVTMQTQSKLCIKKKQNSHNLKLGICALIAAHTLGSAPS